MPPPKGVWGIDIGQCALKALRLEMVDGRPVATAFDYVEHPKILSQPDADPDQLIREALEKFLSRNEIKYDEVAVGIAGQSGLARFVKLPPVEEKKIGDIVKFEAKQQIPFPLDEVVWDYQKVAGGDVTDGFAMETEIGLFAMKKDVIARYLGYFAGSKLEVHYVQMAPLALVNYTTYDILKKGGATLVPPEAAADPEADDTPRGKKRCVVVLDIGTEASNLIITDGGKIIWQRPLPLGGNNFTRALTKELKLTFAKAEHLKRNAAKSPELPQILKALKPVLQDFVGEVQRSLGYFTNTHRDAHVGYMVGLGGAFRLPGLQKYLAEKLQLDVRRPPEFSRTGGDTILKDPLFVENLLTFPVAYGLALQGLGEARLTTNLLPAEIRTDRMIRAKKPYAAAAAAALLLGTAGLALGYGASYKAVSDPSIEKAIKTADAAVKAHGGQDSKYAAKQAEVQQYQDRVKAVVSGSDERLDWPRFDEVLTTTLPRPGEHGNLPASLWKTDKGPDAVRWFEERLRKGVRIDQALDDEKSPMPLELAMVNVEAIYPRWVDNLKQFYDNADAKVWTDYGESFARDMKADEKEPAPDRGPDGFKPKAPDGGGWVVEVRGFFDHKDARQFIRRALLANLQQADTFVDQTDAKGGGKVKKYLPGVEDPVKGRVSHAFIYNVFRPGTGVPGAAGAAGRPAPGAGGPNNPNATPGGNFEAINRSYLDALVAPPTAGGPGGLGGEGDAGPKAAAPPAAGGAGGPAGAAAGPPPAGPAWVPLTGARGTGLTTDPFAGAIPVTPIPSAPVFGGGPGGASAGPLPPPPPPVEGTPRRRYEFVVMFVWREPVQSVGGGTAAAPAGAPAGAPPAGPGPAAPKTP